MNKIFGNVGSLVPGRSVFDLSHDHKTMFDMGQLIPVLCEEMVPGDLFEMSNEIVIRFQPLVAPILHEINAYVHYFFVPYRLLWPEPSGWESFISGGVDGQFAGVLPRWTTPTTTVGSLWDYLGFPTGITPTGALPMSFPRDAYNFIWNEYYRDETLQAKINLDNGAILNRAWEKDYFTSALPWRQRGISPAVPITGDLAAQWDADLFVDGIAPVTPSYVEVQGGGVTNGHLYGSVGGAANIKSVLDNNSIDTSSLGGIFASDLRLVFQIQKWMERNARAGVRYTELIQSHFGVSPRDERLQRPEYLGGSKSPVIVSEVLQTSATGLSGGTTPQGTMAGHGITVDRNSVVRYHAKEFGLIMGIMSVMPRSSYSQGINRQWERVTKFDFYWPEFANLSEQAILRHEIYADGNAGNNGTVFGYQGRYDEMRFKPNKYTGKMRSTFNYWHLGRIFGSAPLLNSSFIECVPDKRIFAVTTEPGLFVDVAHKIRAVRPLPVSSEPGLIDHNGGV